MLVLPYQRVVPVLYLVFGSRVVEQLGDLGPLFPVALDVVEDDEVLPLRHLLLLNIFVEMVEPPFPTLL